MLKKVVESKCMTISNLIKSKLEALHSCSVHFEESDNNSYLGKMFIRVGAPRGIYYKQEIINLLVKELLGIMATLAEMQLHFFAGSTEGKIIDYYANIFDDDTADAVELDVQCTGIEVCIPALELHVLKKTLF